MAGEAWPGARSCRRSPSATTRPIASDGGEYEPPLLGEVENGYGGTLTFGYEPWCYGGGTCGGDVDDYMKQVVISKTLEPGIGPEVVYRYAYSDPGLEQSDEGGAAPHPGGLWPGGGDPRRRGPPGGDSL